MAKPNKKKVDASSERGPLLLSVLRDPDEVKIFAYSMMLMLDYLDKRIVDVDLSYFIKKLLKIEDTVSARRKVIDTLKRCKFLNQTASLTGGMVHYTSILQLAGFGVDENGDPLGYFSLARGWEGIDTREFTTVVEETTIRFEDLINGVLSVTP